MVRFTTTISLPPECADFVSQFHQNRAGTKARHRSFSAWVSWVIRNRKHLGAERATDAEKNADMWLWVAYRMEWTGEPLRMALKAVRTFHDTAWANREVWPRSKTEAHMMMELPPFRFDDEPLENERSEEE